MPLLVRSLDRLRADSWGGILSLRGAGPRFWLSIWLSHVQAGGRLSRDGEGGDSFWRHGSGPLRADVYDLCREPGAAARQDPTGEVSRERYVRSSGRLHYHAERARGADVPAFCP